MPLQESIQIDKLPQTIDELVALRDAIAQTPQGGACVLICALLIHARDPQIGQQALTIAIDRSRLEEGGDGYKGWQLRKNDRKRIDLQLGQQSYLPQSYIQGALPDHGYALPDPPYVIVFKSNPYSGDPDSGTFKAFVLCSGASSPRPVTLKRNSRGFWKASEWSSLLVGIVPAVQEIDDDL